jgi:hypothetical protein
VKQKSSGGVSFFMLLFLVFLILKLAGVIDWSWWWVAAPLWLPAALAVGGFLLAAALGVSIYKVVKSSRRKRDTVPASGGSGPNGGTAAVVDALGSEVTVPQPRGPAAPGTEIAGSAGEDRPAG